MDKDPSQITKEAYDKHEIKYSVYQGLNRFQGTPIPNGYEAEYIPYDGMIPDSLRLVRKEKS